MQHCENVFPGGLCAALLCLKLAYTEGFKKHMIFREHLEHQL